MVAAQINLPRLEAPKEEVPEFLKDDTDYSRLSEAEEKSARLEKLFDKLAVEEEEEQAGLIAEEIWALWTRSGSASVDLALRRASEAQGRGDIKLARRMFDHVTTLDPQFYALWTLGTVMERLERYDDALQIYNEAYKLYPKLDAVAKRREALMSSVEGDVL